LVHELSGVSRELFHLNAVAPVFVQGAEDGIAVLVGKRQVDREILEEALEEPADLLPVESTVVVGIEFLKVLL